MDFVKYSHFFSECSVHIISCRHIRFIVTDSMVIEGENRLSYITILKFCEALRDYFWEYVANGVCDSICKQINSNFFSPICIGDTIDCVLSFVSNSSRNLFFNIDFYCSDTIKSRTVLQVTTYDASCNKSIDLPQEVIQKIKLCE